MGKKIDLTDETFGRLTVIKEVEPYVSPAGYKRNKWLCECSCGTKELKVTSCHLRSGHTQSCGCLQKEKAKEANISHGMGKTSEYETWVGIKQRCYNENNSYYKNYGGRGIRVCDRWLESFENFLEDMGLRPSENHSIERVDVNGDYCKENCVWIENEKQSRNKRKYENNTSGVTGVCFDKSNNRWVASWNDLETGKKKFKRFSIKKYGEEEAFKLACEYRSKMIEELNLKGAGYGEKHGK